MSGEYGDKAVEIFLAEAKVAAEKAIKQFYMIGNEVDSMRYGRYEVDWISGVHGAVGLDSEAQYVPLVYKDTGKLSLENHECEIETGGRIIDTDDSSWVDFNHFVHLDTHANVVRKKITPDLETPIPPEFNRVYGEFKLPQPLKVCECGKDKHGFAAHSRWCGKFEE